MSNKGKMEKCWCGDWKSSSVYVPHRHKPMTKQEWDESQAMWEANKKGE